VAAEMAEIKLDILEVLMAALIKAVAAEVMAVPVVKELLL
tara:strand:- start:19 stop:138 length:120 start_codon:yes stop_codon:yes gene_type:complete